MDAVIAPAEAATYPIYDRRLAYGMLAHLTVADAGTGTPSASADDYATDEDTPLMNHGPRCACQRPRLHLRPHHDGPVA